VFWDYDSPQIRKNRTRLGLDASPAHTPLRVSTPKLKKPTERKCRATVVPPTATDSLPQGAQEALQDLLQYSRKVFNPSKENTDNIFIEGPSDSGVKTSVTVLQTDISTDLTTGISDDESFLIQCSQALDILEKENTNGEKPVVDDVVHEADFETNFCRSDSFDDFLSQLDSDQLEPKPCEESEVSLKRPEPNNLPLSELSGSSLANSPVIFKGIKRFKSSDSGIPAKTLSTGHAGTIRRVHSSPTIPVDPVGISKCSAEEIDRKREMARKKRELSQLTRKRPS
jgi:hypothetical protein